MVDLNTQYLKIKNEIDTAIHNVIDSAYFVKSPVIKEFDMETHHALFGLSVNF